MTRRAVFFDTSDTLYRSPELDKLLASAPIRFLSQKHRMSEEEAERLLKQALSKMASEGISPTKSGAVRNLGYSNMEFQAFISATPTDRYLLPDDADLQALESLAELYTLGIITNIGRIFLSKVLRSLGMSQQLFKCVVTSDDVSEPKPHTEPFVKTLKLVGLPPDCCVYVGDNVQKDLVPANSVGFKTILLGNRRAESFHGFYRTVDCLSDLVPLLASEREFWLA